MNLIGGQSVIYNAIPDQVTQYLVKDSGGNVIDNGRVKPTGKVRMINWYGYPRNFRDLGGWACDGGDVKYGLLYRGAAVGTVESTTVAVLRGLHLRHEIDLRQSNEITSGTFADYVHYHHHPLTLYFDDVIDPAQGDYASIKAILRTVIDAVTHDEAVFYHCAIGRDRTGTVSALILSLLGVAVNDIDKDFELTSFSSLNTPANRTSESYRSLITALKSYGKSTLMHGAVTWALKAGFGIDELNAFRAAMVNGTPSVLKMEDYVKTYTVTQNLSWCTSDLVQSSVAEGDSLTVTITPNTNYEMDTITVTMGSVDITASAVSGNKITIANVTGNIIVTAVAKEIIRYTNVLPLSINTDGSLYVEGKGWKTGYRLSGAEERAQSGWEISGYIPVTAADTFRIANFSMNSQATGYDNIQFYDSAFVYLGTFSNASNYNPFSQWLHEGVLTGCVDTATTTNFTATTKAKIAYMRLSLMGITTNTIVTINEEIV